MLFNIDREQKTAVRAVPISFAELRVRERYDLQEWVIACPELLGEDLLVITAEFDRFDHTSERLDVLALDEEGNLVIVELKRNAIGTHAELQAIRYAAYCSGWSIDDVVKELTAFRRSRGASNFTEDEARAAIVEFAPALSSAPVGPRPRIILAAEQFSKEVLTTVLWLRDSRIDISCVQLVPHQVGERLLVEATVLIPLPEVRDFLIQKERKAAEQAERSASQRTFEDFLATIDQEYRPAAVAMRDWILQQPDVAERVWSKLVGYRATSDRAWFTWMTQVGGIARVAAPPELPTPEGVVSKRTASGWHEVQIRDASDVERVTALLASPARVRHLTLASAS